MHHLIYIPGQPDVPQSLSDVGLSNHIDGASLTACDKGPDGNRGCIATWRGVMPVVEMESQQWIPAVAYEGQPAKRYWVGIDRKKKPRPDQLLRSMPLHGHPVQMGDGDLWTLPPIHGLPQKLSLTDTGKYQQDILPEYQAYYVEVMRQIAKIEGLSGFFVADDLVRIIEMGLRYNYRITPELAASVLGLYTTETLERAFLAITGLRKG